MGDILVDTMYHVPNSNALSFRCRTLPDAGFSDAPMTHRSALAYSVAPCTLSELAEQDLSVTGVLCPIVAIDKKPSLEERRESTRAEKHCAQALR